MTTLKEEYLAKKRLNGMKKLIEAKYMLDENFIVIEAIDQQRLKQMSDAVAKLDSVLSADLANSEDLQPLKAAIDAATSEMQKFVSGGLNANDIAKLFGKEKAFNPITKSMTLFSALAKLFKDDMPKILKAFKIEKLASGSGDQQQQQQAQQEPGQSGQEQQLLESQNGMDIPIDKLPGFDDDLMNKMRDMITKGLRPGGLLGFFGLKSLPYIQDPGAIARGLMSLSVNQLKKIASNVSNIPVPVTASDKADMLKMAQGQVPQGIFGSQPGAPQQSNGQAAETDANAAVAKLGKLPPDQVAKLVQGVTSVADLLSRINQLENPPTQPAPTGAPAQPAQAATPKRGRPTKD
jgi:hypothetical protein